jgi:phosphohistidine swiveling domain-containing protein
MSPLQPGRPAELGQAGHDGSATRAVVRWLDGDAAPEVLGGKAGALARLVAAGLPVPPGFVILPEAFPAAAENGRAVTPAVRSQIREAYEALGRRVGEASPLVAVRSSANLEDLEVASFAGQYQTFLGVRGADEIAARAAACWESLFASHAVRYREDLEARTGRSLPPPAMAVLVQALVAADAAGVAFTADPLSGDRTAVLVNGAWGLGQSVVDGEVEADTWHVDRETRRTVRQTTGHKASRTGIGPGAARVPLPEELQRRPCLTEAQLARVVDLALRAEAVIGAPADVEWAVAGDEVWLLQARAVTTGAGAPESTPSPAAGVAGEPGSAASAQGPSPDFPFSWPDAEALTLHWRRQTRSMPLPALREDVARAFRRSTADAASIKGSERLERCMVLNGYVYAAQVPSPHSEHDRRLRKEAFERAGRALHNRGETYLQTVIFPEVDEGNARLGAVDVFSLEPAALADHLEEALRWYERAWTLHWLWAPNDPRERFAKLYAEITGDQRREAPSELLTHEPNLLTDAVDGLIDLAAIAQRHPPLRARLLTAAPDEVVDALRRDETTAGHAEFLAALEGLLERQGLRCGAGFGVENDEMLPSWREDPSLVVALVQRYVEQDLDALRAARERAVAARDRRVAEVRAGIAGPQRRQEFDFWLGAARRAQQGFEDHNYKIDSAATSLLHLAITGCARRLVDAGYLDAEDEIWFLYASEIALALRGLAQRAGAAAPSEAPQGPDLPEAPQRPHWRDLVEVRRAMHRWQGRLTPPETLGAPAPPERAASEGPAPGLASPTTAAAPQPPDGVLVTGQTGSTGIATGRVRLVDRNVLVPEVTPGDVLVAHNAGPLWTPVFPTVVAVVLDEGVFFQHAMLTCREYGVPAVFQTKEATRRLREGQRVTVDATHGWVLPAE